MRIEHKIQTIEKVVGLKTDIACVDILAEFPEGFNKHAHITFGSKSNHNPTWSFNASDIDDITEFLKAVKSQLLK